MADQSLIEKILCLPPEKVVEVEDFVDFLRTRDQGDRVRSRTLGTPRDEPAVTPRAPTKLAPRPDPVPFDDGFDSFEDDVPWLDRDPTEAELQEEDHFRLRHRESFRAAAEYVAAAFARLGFVHRVVLFGSVARPPERETPRQWRYRRTGAQLWHEIKDVDLAVWVS